MINEGNNNQNTRVFRFFGGLAGSDCRSEIAVALMDIYLFDGRKEKITAPPSSGIIG
jgi:hypothetical protein